MADYIFDPESERELQILARLQVLAEMSRQLIREHMKLMEECDELKDELNQIRERRSATKC
jgi:hypothetical protein